MSYFFKNELFYTDIPINVIFGYIGILVYKIHTYNIFKKVRPGLRKNYSTVLVIPREILDFNWPDIQ